MFKKQAISSRKEGASIAGQRQAHEPIRAHRHGTWHYLRLSAEEIGGDVGAWLHPVIDNFEDERKKSAGERSVSSLHPGLLP